MVFRANETKTTALRYLVIQNEFAGSSWSTKEKLVSVSKDSTSVLEIKRRNYSLG